MYLMVDVYRKMISVPWIPMVRNFTMIACKKAHPFPVVLWGSPHLPPPLTGLTHSLGTSLPCFNEEKSTEWQWALKHFSSFVPWQGANPVWEEVCDLSE